MRAEREPLVDALDQEADDGLIRTIEQPPPASDEEIEEFFAEQGIA